MLVNVIFKKKLLVDVHHFNNLNMKLVILFIVIFQVVSASMCKGSFALCDSNYYSPLLSSPCRQHQIDAGILCWSVANTTLFTDV